MLVVGGRGFSGPIAVAEIYDPTTRTFSVTGTSLEARADHAAVRLDDGRVLVIGGRGRDQALASTEIYDSKTNTFEAGPSLTHSRYGHTATLLADGRVVVIGGDATGCAEIYEPSTGAFKELEQCLAISPPPPRGGRPSRREHSRRGRRRRRRQRARHRGDPRPRKALVLDGAHPHARRPLRSHPAPPALRQGPGDRRRRRSDDGAVQSGRCYFTVARSPRAGQTGSSPRRCATPVAPP